MKKIIPNGLGKRSSLNKAKKVLITALAIGVIAAGLTACGGSGGSNSGGSDSGDLSGSVSTNGSTSMESVVGVLSEQFMNDNPGVSVSYDATGSGTGIEAVNNGTCDIGLSSRDLSDEEKGSGLEQTTIALDGIAIIVNENNDTSDLSIEDVAAIYTGTNTRWDAGGEIVPIGREAGSGTRDGFESVTQTEDKCKLTQELTSTGAVIEAVKSNENAIGYASFASVKDQKGIKVLSIGGVECSEANISDGSYAIQRDFNLITKSGTELSAQAQAFYDYAVSNGASSLISEAGAVPVAK